MFRFSGVSFSALSRKGKYRSVFSGLEVVVEQGETLAVSGPNGSGKSTFLRMILGIQDPFSGCVQVSNRARNCKTAYVPQDYRKALLPWVSVEKNMILHIGDGRIKECHRFLSKVELDLDTRRYPYELSGGEQQLLLLCMTLSRRSDLLLLDEPLSAVDKKRQGLAATLLERVTGNSSVTTVCVSHNQNVLNRIGGKRLVFSGDADVSPVVGNSG